MTDQDLAETPEPPPYPWFDAAVGAEDLARVPAELADAAAALVVSDPAACPELSASLRHVAAVYLADKSVESFYEHPGTIKPALKRFLRAKGEATLADFVGPEYVVTIQGLAEHLQQGAIAQMHPSRELPLALFVRKAAAIFLDEYEPRRGRPAQLPLEEAVRRLVDLLRCRTGRLPKVSLNKNNGRQPELRSPEANAIGLLLSGVDPQLPEWTIVNMIQKVNGQPQPTEHQLLAVIGADPLADLDASLSSNRKDAIQALIAELL